MALDERLIARYLSGDARAALALERECAAARERVRHTPSVRTIRSAIMFTDVADSVGLYDTYGDAYGRAIVQRHDAITSEAVAAERGAIVKYLGDGVLARFADSRDAVRAGVRVQLATRQHRKSFPLLGFRVCIGINVGPGIATDTDVYGASVNLAARLCAAAPADTIYTTGIVAARCAELGLEFVELGSTFFKGFGAPIPVALARVPD